ncbi:hypothetical protein MG293_015879 [Ovis ammon polii]|uniref:Protein FAM32A n=1 Tax=Ovis ammon polii TaxID=230172 RepID=A0AAD4TZ11_OVIAM|nr:hypothetical protein MG293_015879 [Ovis ammon polii]
MAENQTAGRGRLADSPGAESPASAPRQDTGRGKPDSALEELRIRFRRFSSSEEPDPIKALRRFRDLCGLWLRPDLHTKEQMVDRLVLEQFVMCMPPEIQVLVRSSGAETCKDLEEVLRKKQKLKKWTVVRVQGEDFLMPVSDVEMLGFEVSEGHDEGDRAREPQSAVSVVPPDEGQQESQDGQHLPGAKDLSREQGQKALPPETIPETGELEGQMPSQENLEKDLLEDTGVTRTLPSQEPELLQDGEGDISTTSGSRRGPLKNRRHVLRKRDRSPTCQDERPEAATCLEQGELSGQRGSHSVASSGTVGPTSVPEGAETPGRALCECRKSESKMGSMDAYEQVQKGPLKLKGGPELGVTKRKKKKDRDKAKLLQTMGKIQKNQEEDLRRHLDKRTPAQVAFEKVQEKRQMERVLKKASTTHKQRVEEFNRHLDMLSEHYDIPKVSWTK